MKKTNRFRRVAVFEILNLIVAVAAFTFLVGLSVESVSGAEPLIRENNKNTGPQKPGMQVTSPSTTTNPAPAGGSGGGGGAATLLGVAPAALQFLNTKASGSTPGVNWAGAQSILASEGGPIDGPFKLTSSGGTNYAINTKTGDVWATNPGIMEGTYMQVPQDTLPTAIKDSALGSSGGGGNTPNPALTPESGGILGAFDWIFKDTVLGGLAWGTIIGGIAGYVVGGMMGMTKNNQYALFMGTFAGVMTYQITNPLFSGKGVTAFGQDVIKGGGKPWFGSAGTSNFISLGLAIGVGLMVFNALYKKESKKVVTFQCLPWEAPTGGQYCELCNKDPFRPCSEYRCKSLGQACQLLNAGTGEEACAWVNPHDVTSPTIEPWQDALTPEHKYTDVKTRPPGTGMRVIRNAADDGCIKAFTPLSFGIATNEPTQCKIDYNHTTNTRDVRRAYDTMQYYFGESNLYMYNHTQTLRLPGPAALAAQNASPELTNDGTYTLYARCQDANGNVNEDEFSIRFCVEKGPDTTPAKIEGTSIPNGMPVSYGVNDTDIEVYVNEPADCRWSREDKDYDFMENDMVCDQNVWDINNNMLYKCYTKLTGFENRKDNLFYFRCKDQPYFKGTEKDNDRNKNAESYSFIIKGTQPVNIVKSEPNGTIKGYANVVPINLRVETANGFNKGDATCYYSERAANEDCLTKSDESYIKMFETGTNKHRQQQDLNPGTYTFCFKCVDLGGNADYNSTTFTIEVDRGAPIVIRVYNEGGNLKIETDEKSTCYYSTAINQKCNYNMPDGTQMLYTNATQHYAEWKSGTNYYIKCADSSGNQPLPTVCSIIVRPYNKVVSK